MELTPNIVDEVVAACKTGADETAAALDRAFGLASTVQPGKPSTFQANAQQKDLQGEGLILVLGVGASAAVLAFPAAGGIAPPWCAAPDPTGQSKLDTLAQELAMNVLPEALFADACRTVWVRNVSQALALGGVSGDAPLVPLQVSVGGASKGSIALVWPVVRAAAIVAEPVAAAKPSVQALAAPTPGPALPPRKSPYPPPVARKALPAYTRSLLKIKVPVVVTLAEKRQSLGKIIELGPGAIIQFDKSCEEMLDLVVGNQPIASGEAVKVGDKFGLRITSITPPEERFRPVAPSRK